MTESCALVAFLNNSKLRRIYIYIYVYIYIYIYVYGEIILLK